MTTPLLKPTYWSLNGFVKHFEFVHKNMLDHRFVWVLGAGASLGSGIPLGGQLVDVWLSDLHEKATCAKLPLADWCEQHLGIDGFDYARRGEFYSQVYVQRFHEYPDEGFAFFEKVMAGKEPSLGYSILAKALAQQPPRHNAVVTTNFDNLVADSLAVYTDTIPFVCGHESLADFVRLNRRRPVICKIHRDLLLGPQNDPRELRRLHDSWGQALRELFREYTPIFIGYGGNDDTLMDLLESLYPGDIKGQLIWCHYEQSVLPDRIANMVASHKGVCVPAPDFDSLMALLGDKMQIQLLDQEIADRARHRARRYRKRIRELQYSANEDVKTAIDATIQETGNWWNWHRLAAKENDPLERLAIYKRGLKRHPSSPDLHRSYATALKLQKKYSESRAEYEIAISLDPDDATTIGDFAALYAYQLEEVDLAEKMYRRALALDTVEAHTITDFAIFLAGFRDDLDETERLFLRAIELNPQDADNVLNYAEFLITRNRFEEAIDQVKTAKLGQCEAELSAVLAIFDGVLCRITNRSDETALAQVGDSVAQSFNAPLWQFDNLLACVKSQLSGIDQQRYTRVITLLSGPPTSDSVASIKQAVEKEWRGRTRKASRKKNKK